MATANLNQLHRCALAYQAGEGEIQLFPDGKFVKREALGVGTEFEMNAAIAAVMMAAFNSANNDIAIDYEHQLINAARNGQPAPAAGWIKSLVWRAGHGLFAAVDWTEKAREMIKAGAYRYISPVFYADKITRAIAPVLVPPALTNHPAIDGMAQAIAASQNLSPSAMEPTQMDLKKLALILGLPETATEDEVMAKIKSMVDAPTAATVAASIDHSQFVPIAAVQQLQVELASVKQGIALGQVQQLVAASLADGRLPKALEAWALLQTPQGLTAYLASAPVIPALQGMQTVAANLNGAPPVAALSAAEMEICSRTNISHDAFRAAQGA